MGYHFAAYDTSLGDYASSPCKPFAKHATNSVCHLSNQPPGIHGHYQIKTGLDSHFVIHVNQIFRFNIARAVWHGRLGEAFQ